MGHGGGHGGGFGGRGFGYGYGLPYYGLDDLIWQPGVYSYGTVGWPTQVIEVTVKDDDTKKKVEKLLGEQFNGKLVKVVIGEQSVAYKRPYGNSIGSIKL